MDETTPKQVAPLTLGAQENKLVQLAMKQAEKQLADGTASSQVVTHFLKLGSVRNEVEVEKLRLETALVEERIQSEKTRQNLDTMFAEVLDALKGYKVDHEEYDQ